MTAATLAARVRQGEARAVARAISVVEAEGAPAAALVAALHPHASGGTVIGLTGPPGAGKSTLVDGLTRAWRGRGHRVGVIAVDPSSPFTGGALLGDRVRMQQHASDEGVFIRSMATRGHLGGLASATTDVAIVLGAAGYDIVLIETVGVGQDEVDVVRAADVCIVVVVPGGGDEVQALKAGVMEIADIYVVNKADRDGADATVAAIAALQSLQPAVAGAWRPPIIRAQAINGAGIPDLVDGIDRCLEGVSGPQGGRRRRRSGQRIKELVARQLLAHVDQAVLSPGEFEGLLDRVERHELDPHAVAAIIVGRLLRRP